ncbi:MAG: hypothetical protein HN352_14800 [Bacteroidetes bacterium]|nr:hypothetical protein [Bacteroidota bacterium]MBT3747642.1 hypothetical protein [Bacteroidota bacterium]MBT4402064.1 hypothetical protein [Bacteroidota bacterium]MBT4409423.1 hypothetical protein [Bacteroidota bacterium]MBT7093060.1 hypothetical protein [Bacteroidota bacterium]
MVFLALANVKPADSWNNCQAPLLQTYFTMDFNRNRRILTCKGWNSSRCNRFLFNS